MVDLVIYRNEEDPIENEGACVLTTFSPLKPYESCCHGTQSFSPTWSKTINLFLTKMMLQIKFYCNWPAGCGDIYEYV